MKQSGATIEKMRAHRERMRDVDERHLVGDVIADNLKTLQLYFDRRTTYVDWRAVEDKVLRQIFG